MQALYAQETVKDIHEAAIMKVAAGDAGQQRGPQLSSMEALEAQLDMKQQNQPVS